MMLKFDQMTAYLLRLTLAASFVMLVLLTSVQSLQASEGPAVTSELDRDQSAGILSPVDHGAGSGGTLRPTHPMRRAPTASSSAALRSAAIAVASAAQGKTSGGVESKFAEPAGSELRSSMTASVDGAGAGTSAQIDLASMDLSQPVNIQRLQACLDQLCASAAEQRTQTLDLTSYQRGEISKLDNRVANADVKIERQARQLAELARQLEAVRRSITTVDPAVRVLSGRLERLEWEQQQLSQQLLTMTDSLSHFAERLGMASGNVSQSRPLAGRGESGKHEAPVLPLLTVTADKVGVGRRGIADASGSARTDKKSASDQLTSAVIGQVIPVPECEAGRVTSSKRGLSYRTQWAILGLTAAGIAYAKSDRGCVIS